MQQIRVKLADARAASGMSVAELARQTGVSRQTVYAIESGSFIPNTAVALRMAKVLGVSVEQLFALEEEPEREAARYRAVMIAGRPQTGAPVRLARLPAGWVCAPGRRSGYYLSGADGRIVRVLGGSRVEVESPATAGAERSVAVAGCDPALGLLAAAVQSASTVQVLLAPVSSRKAVELLKRGHVHVAGLHLKDPASEEWNLPFLRRVMKEEELEVVTFALWEEGLVTARGNPLHLRRVEDLARPAVRFVNRERGSGSRVLLDRLLREAGVAPSRIPGYDREAEGHLAAAAAVARGEADCCIAASSAARAFGLDFVTLQAEQFDLAVRRASMGMPSVKVVLDVIATAAFRNRLAAEAGYDAAATGRSRRL